jgi:hypothetical protein
MPWTASRRWVFPNLRIVVSRTRTPDSNWQHGYSLRAYDESLFLGFANGSWTPVEFYVSFWSGAAQPFLEFGFGGTLLGHQSDKIRLLDHPGVTIPDLGTATSGEILLEWSGWFEVYASDSFQLSAWNEIFDKGDTEVHGHRHVRTLDVFEAAMPRPDPLEFPDMPGRPSDVWAASSVDNSGNGATTEDARCGDLRASIASLASDIADAQSDLSFAEPGEKQGLVAKINRMQAQRDALIQQARALGCRLR